VLDPIEQARAAVYARESDRARFVLGVALLKSAVAKEHQIEPNAVHINRSCATCDAHHGAPRVVDSNLHVSVAHSGARVIAALTPAGPVGVDVESRTSRLAMPPARDVLTPAEVLLNVDDFLTYWCRKESMLKATGAGLTVSLLDVVVSPASEPARLVSFRGDGAPAFMTDLDLGPRFAAAVTVLTNDVVSVEVLSAETLLRSRGGGLELPA
jgi:4'-phosphopantetheinyl transferase